MNLSCGIIGLPNVGKSTLFNALLSRQVADMANYPFCTIEPNTGVVKVPDKRLEILSKISESEKIVPAAIKFVDIAGLVKGASKGEGLGNKFLSHIREVNLIIHVIRSFEDTNIARAGSDRPESDYDLINTELCLADFQTIEKQREPKGMSDKDAKLKWRVILKLKEKLAKGIPIRNIDLDKEEKEAIKELNLITQKKEIIVLNVSETQLSNISNTEQSISFGDGENKKPIVISAKVECDLIGLKNEEKSEYLESLGIKSSGLEKLIKKAHETLGLIDFLTTGKQETRAWTIKKGAMAPEAAGTIHTDFQKGFIRAAVVSFDDFVKHNGWKALKETGKVRFEGKDYEMKEGD
ncbi:redox-regulated ATPase YchF, partial [bacterium]